MPLSLVDRAGGPACSPAGRLVDRWAVASQHHARRNGRVAATALTPRRTETREVEDHVASRQVRRPSTGAATTALPR